jgi:glycosyltransferase involved in cell wall biosynthesis
VPSRAEPFGLVLLEAAYHKKGIVGTSVGGVPEIIANGVNGLLVEPDDPAAWRPKSSLSCATQNLPNGVAIRRTRH